MPTSTLARWLVLALLLSGGTALYAGLGGPPAPADAPLEAPMRVEDPMRGAAQALLATLTAEQRARATFAFDDAERYNWHFTPRERRGVPLKAMTLAQRRAAHALLRAGLSDRGYLKATHVMHLESILHVLENNSPRRDPELYFFSVFGDPASQAQPWGWRVEGHHLSLNYTSVADTLVAVTPAFFGSNPAEVRSGPHAGLRVLGAEEDDGRALFLSLTPAQRRRALVDDAAPPEIVTGVARAASLEAFEGLPAAEMTPAQQAALWRLVEVYARNLRPGLAEGQLGKLQAAGGAEPFYFAWAGSAEVGAPHYYRLHSPTTLIEYDNTQNDANHVHTVWRDFEGDWGEDLLRRHYRTAPAGHGH